MNKNANRAFFKESSLVGQGPKTPVDEALKFSSPLGYFPSQLGLGGVFPPKNQANF